MINDGKIVSLVGRLSLMQNEGVELVNMASLLLIPGLFFEREVVGEVLRFEAELQWEVHMLSQFDLFIVLYFVTHHLHNQ